MSLYLEYLHKKNEKTIALLPFEIFLMVSNADGVMTRREFDTFFELLENPTWCYSKYMRQISERTINHLMKLKHFFEFNQQYRNRTIKGNLVHIKQAILIAERFLTPSEITVLADDLKHLVDKIVEVSAEEAYESEVSEEEQLEQQRQMNQLNNFLQNPHSQTLSLRKLLLELPFQLFLLISDADNEIDKNELALFVRILKDRKWCKSYCAQTIFTQTLSLYQEFFQAYRKGKLKKDFGQIEKTIQIASKVFSVRDLQMLKTDLSSMAKKIAQASGGFAGISAISIEENAILAKLESLLLPYGSSLREAKKAKGNEEYIFSTDPEIGLREAENQNELRGETRVRIPDTKVTIYIGGSSLSAKPLNFSDRGLLCEIELEKDELGLTEGSIDIVTQVHIIIELSEKYKKEVLGKIFCKIIRLGGIEWDSNSVLIKMNLALKFIKFINQDKEKYFHVLDQEVKNSMEDEDEG